MDGQALSSKINNVASQSSMHTREKIGNLCKRMLCYILDRRNSYMKIQDIIADIGGDTKKVIDLVFVLDGVGLLTRVSKNKFVYTGFKGMNHVLNDYIRTKFSKKPWLDTNSTAVLFTEEIAVADKPVNIKCSVYLGKFVARILCKVLLSPNKIVLRNDIDSMFDEYSMHFKDAASKSTVNDMITLLFSLNLIEKNENNDSITWIGPDCINVTGVNVDSLQEVENIQDIIRTRTPGILAKEVAYFSNLLKEEIAANKFSLSTFQKSVDNTHQNGDTNTATALPVPESEPNDALPKFHVANYEPGGYAFIKGKNISYLMQKPYAFIGRTAHSKDPSQSTYNWDVDIDLVDCSSVSRQHAVILYNFEEQHFEIKCLSRKSPIKIGEQTYRWKDKPYPLKGKTVITIASETLVFYLPSAPKTNNAESQKKETDSKAGDLKNEEDGEDVKKEKMDDEEEIERIDDEEEDKMDMEKEGDDDENIKNENNEDSDGGEEGGEEGEEGENDEDGEEGEDGEDGEDGEEGEEPEEGEDGEEGEEDDE